MFNMFILNPDKQPKQELIWWHNVQKMRQLPWNLTFFIRLHS